MSEVNDVTALVNLAAHQPVAMQSTDGREFIARPNGPHSFALEQITPVNSAPVYMPKLVTQHVKMQTADSLEEYVNRFKNDNTVLFADIANDTIRAIIDYHRQPTANVPRPTDAKVADPISDQPVATLGVHQATLHLPKSLEWQTWTKASGMMMTHTAFATFLEENSIDVVSPPGADLLELCRDLQVIQNVKFGSTVRMGDVTELNYAKEADATSKGTVAMPQSIMLSIPVYFDQMPVSIEAFMRRQIEDGKLRLGIQLSRAENVRQMEFHRIVDSVAMGTDHLTTVYGTPV